MKAMVYHNYGSPDVLKCEELEKPTAGDHEVLTKVRAAAVNPLDWHFMRGAPYVLRIPAGLSQPKNTRLGVDLAGQVEAAGRNVTQFQPVMRYSARAEAPSPSMCALPKKRWRRNRPTSHSSRRRPSRLQGSALCRVFAIKDGFSRGRRS